MGTVLHMIFHGEYISYIENVMSCTVQNRFTVVLVLH